MSKQPIESQRHRLIHILKPEKKLDVVGMVGCSNRDRRAGGLRNCSNRQYND